MQLLREGVIGKVYMPRASASSAASRSGGPPMARFRWVSLGQVPRAAPMRPFNPLRFTYNCTVLGPGNGDIGNQGAHEMDIARWGLGKQGMPTAVVPRRQFVYDDDPETPNTQIATFDYGDAELVFEVRGILTGGEGGMGGDRPARGPRPQAGSRPQVVLREAVLVP